MLIQKLISRVKTKTQTQNPGGDGIGQARPIGSQEADKIWRQQFLRQSGGLLLPDTEL